MPLDQVDKLAQLDRRRIERAVRMRNAYGVVALCAFIFAVINSDDGNALQWPAAITLVVALFLYATAALGVWSVRHRR